MAPATPASSSAAPTPADADAASAAAVAGWLSPTPGLNYGIIVALQSVACAVCVVLAILEYVASRPGAAIDMPSLEWAKDSGWWIMPAPFIPSVVYFGLLWSAQKSEAGPDAKAGAAKKDM
mmetsp:Transcript_78284/g.199028  ORF Transcript_78284/g.199028 Transcript_78284/m.199028 type:complete len:121 (+) Transcript_78284:85-447(+)